MKPSPVIRVTQLVETLYDAEDQESLPAGESGIGSHRDYHNMTLDEFHFSVPIGCLEDFDIIEM